MGGLRGKKGNSKQILGFLEQRPSEIQRKALSSTWETFLQVRSLQGNYFLKVESEMVGIL